MKRSLRLKANNNGSPVYGQTVGWVNSPERLLPPGFSLTRANTGTHFDSAGLLQTAAIDAPRGTYRYNGSAWVFDGTIVEAAAVNLCLQSQTFDNASWIKPNATVTANAAVAPDGTTTADLLYPNLSGGNMYTNQNTITTAAAWTFSYYAKYAGIQWVCNISLNGAAYGAYFDVQNGIVGTVAAGHSARISSVGNGWYRCEVTTTTAPAGAGNVFIESVDADNNGGVVTANGTAGVYLWGAQLELGSAATSYIPTTTVAVTRAADVLTAPTSGLLANAQGFAAMGYRAIAGESTDSECIITTYSGSGGIPLRRSASALALFDGTANRALGLVLPNVAGTVYKAATTWGGSTCNGAVNGVVGTPATFDGSMDLGATLRIGDNVSALTVPLSMVLQSLRLGIRAATNVELGSWTV